ncbi:MAG TPA: hypothetical protein VMV05_05050 [bacterium]|nr:hypothetical protein [bacterium]
MDSNCIENQSREQDPLTEKIIGRACAVSNTLGVGFLEKVKDVLVGEFVAELLVEDRVLVELKSVQTLESVLIGG